MLTKVDKYGVSGTEYDIFDLKERDYKVVAVKWGMSLNKKGNCSIRVNFIVT